MPDPQHAPASAPVSPESAWSGSAERGEATERPVITVAGVVVRRENGDVLTVRKRGTHMFMFPGGKPEPGESPRHTVVREVAEELGLTLDGADLVPVGQWLTDAANEPGHGLRSHVFLVPQALSVTPQPAAEIEELRWQPVGDVERVDDLAPLARWFAIPAVRERF